MMIVHRIMRDHGGDIGIDSKTGSGTIVTLRFPRSAVWKKIIRCKQMNPNLLIVDDEQHTREIELTPEDKFEIFLASNPTEANNVMEAEELDVVLTDLKMGNHSGMSVY